MTLTCQRCQRTRLPDESRFCFACGAEIAPDSDRSAPEASYTPAHLARDVLGVRSTRAGERKDVSVLLADVAGSLSFAQSLDPEDMHEVMDGLFSLVIDAVHTEQGTINQFRGDGFMALFGAPRARRDNALRALRAALRLREQLIPYAESVRARFGLPLRVRTGVSTGTVWVGTIGSGRRRDYTAEGPTVGLAARLEQEAEPGQILIDEETARRAQPFFELSDLGTRRLRGVTRDVRVFALIGRGLHDRRLDLEQASGLTPFAGREEELATLRRAWARAALWRVVLVDVRGEAGIGKSRLVLEHRRRAGGHAIAVWCREADVSRALAPWLPLLRAWPPFLPGSEPAERIARALTGEAAAGGISIVDAVVQLLIDAAIAPLCIVVDDAHWMDPSTKLVIERLVQRGADLPILVILTSRAELGLESLGAAVEMLRLGPLTPNDDAKIARAILGVGPGAGHLVELARHRAAGNPLYLEEICRTLRDAPEAVRSTARLEARLARSPFAVPSTLQGIIAARIDALAERSKRLLEAAAIALGPLTRALLAEIDPLPGGEIETALRDLTELGLLVRIDPERWEITHALVREVAYAQVLRQRRSDLHRRCAGALEKDAAGDGAAGHSRVGMHYDLAGDATRAAQHLGRAGEAYLALHAHAEAVAHLRRAWEIHCAAQGRDLDRSGALGAALAAALNALDRSDEAGAVLDALDTNAIHGSDRLSVGRVFVQSGWVAFSSQRKIAHARTLLERGIRILDEAPEGRHDAGTAYAYLSRICHVDGELDASIDSARRLVEIAVAAGSRFGIAIGRAYEGGPLCDRGDVERAVAVCEEAATLGAELRNDVVVSLAGAFLARALAFRGNVARASEHALRAIEAAERIGQRGAMHIALVALGLVHLLSDEPARAAAAFDRLGVPGDAWDSASDYRARGLLETGRLDEAADLARACLERCPPRLVRARTLCTLGLAVGLRSAGTPEAERYIAASISLCEERGLLPLLAEAHVAFAELWTHHGEAERAAYFRERAVAGFERCAMPLHAQRAARIGI